MNSTGVKSGDSKDGDRRARRTKRSIRFSDPEWRQVETAAAERGITPSDYVRSAVLGAAAGTSTGVSGGLSPALEELFKLTHRSVYILSTLKRNEMVREGRAGEMDEVVREARKAQVELLSSRPDKPEE